MVQVRSNLILKNVEWWHRFGVILFLNVEGQQGRIKIILERGRAQGRSNRIRKRRGGAGAE